MRSLFPILLLVATLLAVGCSKKSDAVAKESVRRFVPETAAEIVSSPEWKLEFTAKSGLQCYVRILTTNEVALITEDHPDRESLQETSDPSQPPYLLVEVKDGSRIKELSTAQGFEVMGFIMKRDKGLQDQLKKVGTP